MPLYAEGRVEHQKRTQTATTLWPFGFVFGVQLGSLGKRKRGVPGTCRAASFIEMDFNPQADRLSESFRNAGMSDCGIYPLSSRFYMDQVPLDLFQFGKVSLNPEGAVFYWIIGADKKSLKRFGTIQL